MTTNSADYPAHPLGGHPISLDELAQRKGVRPIESADDLAQDGVFNDDDELDAFLEHVTATRHADLA